MRGKRASRHDTVHKKLGLDKRQNATSECANHPEKHVRNREEHPC